MCHGAALSQLPPSELPRRRPRMEQTPEDQGGANAPPAVVHPKGPRQGGASSRPSGRGRKGHPGLPRGGPECSVEIHGYRSPQ
eukprot:2260262-Alexandrium_andersonii.AAC.1